MISNIKHVATLGKNLSELNSKVSSYGEEIASLKQSLDSVSESVREIQADLERANRNQAESLATFNKRMQDIKEISDQFKKSVYDFSVLKKDMQNEILSKFDTRLREELIRHSESLSHSMEEYDKLRSAVHDQGRLFKDLTKETEKLCGIAAGLKKSDFEFTRYADRIRKTEQEKTELLRKIDALERLAARLRRK